MKMLIPSLLVLAVLAGSLSGGEEPTVLSRLEQEIRDLTERADRAVVELSATGSSWRDLSDPRSTSAYTRLAWYWFQRGNAVVGRASAVGVLAGDPPVIVTTAGALGDAREVDYRLADGRRGKATLILEEPDLGVAVYALPEEVASGLAGLEIDPALRVARGRLGVVAGPGRDDAERALGLVTTRGSDVWGGWFHVDGTTAHGLAGLPLVGPDGRLLGISIGSGRPAPDPAAAATRALTYYDLAYRLWQRGDARNDSGIAFYKPEVAQVLPYLALPAGAFLSGGVIARVLEDLQVHGRVRHGYLGVVLGQARGREDSLGVEILAVLDGSPAERAGLKASAKIRSVDDEPVTDPAFLNRAFVLRRPGETVRLGLVGTEEEVEIVLGDRDEAERSIVTPESLGFTCVELGAELRGFLELGKDVRGVVVREVAPDSVADRAGIARGDVIVAGGGECVEDLGELAAAVAGARNLVNLEVIRAGKILRIILRPPQSNIRDQAR